MNLVLSLVWIELKNLAGWFVVILDCSFHKLFNRLSTLFQAYLSKKPYPPCCASLFSLTTTTPVILESVEFQQEIMDFPRYTFGQFIQNFYCVLIKSRFMVEYRAPISWRFDCLSSWITWKTCGWGSKLLRFSCKKKVLLYHAYAIFSKWASRWTFLSETLKDITRLQRPVYSVSSFQK